MTVNSPDLDEFLGASVAPPAPPPAPDQPAPEQGPVEGITGLNADFAQRLEMLINASGGSIYIVSGFRSNAEQQALWNNNPDPKWVARPGTSNHEKGIAADLGGNLALAHQLAPQFGLVFPMSWENWHIEPVGVRTDPATPKDAYTSPTTKTRPATKQEQLASVADAFIRGPSQTTGRTASPQQQAQKDALAAERAAEVQQTPGAEAGKSLPTLAQEEAKLAAQPGTEAPQAPAGVPERWTNTPVAPPGQEVVEEEGGAVEVDTAGGDWIAAVLRGLGAPVTSENVRFMTAWQRAEGGHTNNTARFNWLNTTMTDVPGHTPQSMNSHGVQVFESFGVGVTATVNTLRLGHYTGIVNALKQGTSAMAAAQALAASPWGTGAAVVGMLGG